MSIKPLQRRRQIRQQNENWYSLCQFQARHIEVLQLPTAKYLEEREQQYQLNQEQDTNKNA